MQLKNYNRMVSATGVSPRRPDRREKEPEPLSTSLLSVLGPEARREPSSDVFLWQRRQFPGPMLSAVLETRLRSRPAEPALLTEPGPKEQDSAETTLALPEPRSRSKCAHCFLACSPVDWTPSKHGVDELLTGISLKGCTCMMRSPLLLVMSLKTRTVIRPCSSRFAFTTSPRKPLNSGRLEHPEMVTGSPTWGMR